MTSGASEKIGFTGAALATATLGVNGTDSTLLLNTGVKVRSHAISAGGIITVDDADTFAGAVSLTSTADVAAAAQYLQSNCIGAAGRSVAFTALITGVTHTFVYIQAATNSNSELVELINVSATSLVAGTNQLSVLENTAPTAPSITSITENGGGGINAGEASNGTPVVVSLSSAGATSGDTLTVNWGTQAVAHAARKRYHGRQRDGVGVGGNDHGPGQWHVQRDCQQVD